MNETYDTSENLIEQILDDGRTITFHFGDDTVSYDSYDDFLIHWEETGIPCWDCGHELFKLRSTDYLHCFGLSKWLGEV